MRYRIAAALTFASGAAAMVACQLLAGITDRAVDPPLVDAATPQDSSPPLDAGADSLCQVAGLPARPTTADDTSLPSFITALRTLDFGNKTTGTGAVPAVGFDLDCIDTCPGMSSCKPHANAMSLCDLDGGRDNELGSLIAAFSGFIMGDAAAYDINALVASGQLDIVLRVFNYNGHPDDPNVWLAAYVSNGTAYGADGGPILPRWDGSDGWTVDPNSVTNADAGVSAEELIPAYIDKNAYVSGGVLVSIIGSLVLPVSLGTGTASFSVSGGVVTATLAGTPSSGFYLASGQIGSRVSTRSILSGLVAFRDPASVDNTQLCGSSYGYQFIKGSFICPSADINAGRQDNVRAQCDALSVAIGFSGAPAQIVAVRARPPVNTRCEDASTPWTDECAQDYGN